MGHGFPFLGEYQATFEKSHIFDCFWPFYPLYEAKNKYGSGRIVYGSTNLKIVLWGLHTTLQVPPKELDAKFQLLFFLVQANVHKRSSHNIKIFNLCAAFPESNFQNRRKRHLRYDASQIYNLWHFSSWIVSLQDKSLCDFFLTKEQTETQNVCDRIGTRISK